MKRMSAMLLVMLFLLLVGCSAVGTETDYPAAIMAEGTVYLKSVSAMPAEIDESAIIGYTTSYTDTYPEKDGETNFNRELNMPYARVEGGIAVLYENEWYLCTPKDEDAGAGGGTISFYAEPTREGTDPVDFHCSTTVQCTELFLYWLECFHQPYYWWRVSWLRQYTADLRARDIDGSSGAAAEHGPSGVPPDEPCTGGTVLSLREYSCEQ